MRTFSLFIIGLVFGAAGGFVVAAGNGITLDGHDHADPAHHGAEMAMAGIDHSTMDHSGMDLDGAEHAMMHSTPLEVNPANAPKVEIAVTKDPMAGYNLRVMVERFVFSPVSASLAHIEGQGHAHVYVNGVKLARLYGEWVHLDNLPDGDVEISVSLNSNDHRPLISAGVPIEAKTTITSE